MSQIRQVLLCGHSLFISSIQACLQDEPELELQQVDPHLEDIRKRITVWQPDVLILEAALLLNAFALQLLQGFPRLKIIGLDIEDNQLMVFSGSASCEPTPEDLLHVVQGV
jgi:hypothetical protein